jgi:hypothetical protein
VALTQGVGGSSGTGSALPRARQFGLGAVASAPVVATRAASALAATALDLIRSPAADEAVCSTDAVAAHAA